MLVGRNARCGRMLVVVGVVVVVGMVVVVGVVVVVGMVVVEECSLW